MNSIELTQQHKDKLLEMCNTLFPEYHVEHPSPLARELIKFEFHKNGEDYFEPGDEEYIMVPIKNKRWVVIYKYIHWFEFCMTHLLDKISMEYDDYIYKEFKTPGSYVNYLDGTIATGLQMSVIKGMNPIDYLYSQFKELKKYENS